MRYNTDRAKYEASLARAHRALVNARNTAAIMGDSGAEEDCWRLEKEVIRLAEGSLKGPIRVSRRPAA